MIFGRYILLAFAAGVATAAVVGAFTYAVDPYAMWANAARPGWADNKPTLHRRTRLAKPYQIESFRPRTVILGNSRAESGIDPDGAAWPAQSRPVFNLAIGGSTLMLQ